MTKVIEQVKTQEIEQGKEKRNVPKLRFRGFEDEWEEKTLGSLLRFKNGINADKDAYGKGVKFINVLDILNNNYITADKIIGKVSIDLDTLNKYIVNYGDVLFQRSSETREEVGTANVYLDKESVTFGGFVIRGEKIGEYEPLFMNNLLKSSSARKEITTKAGGSTRYNVSQEILSEVLVKFPSLQEQKKIAQFFTLIDKKIEKQGEKVDALKTYKKGIMQKIFSREIRFKDENGREYPEWEEKRLGDIIELKSVRNSNNNVNFILSVSNSKGFICQDEQFEDRIVASSNVSNYKVVNKDDFAFNPSRINVGSIARLKYFEQGIVSPMYICFRCKSRLKNDFLEFFLDTYHFNAQVKNKLEGSVRQSLSSDSLCSIKINLPCLKEQVKIANFLTIINKKIEKEEKKLEKLKVYKKGLLQKMFV